MHTAHKDIHEHGLQDNCPACLEHAENPFSNLDAEMLSKLVYMTLKMRMDPHQAEYPRTETEAIARANVMNALEHMGKMFEVMQLTDSIELLVYYFQHYWRIDI